jgi:fructose-bisphosphate aldolase, class I
MLKYNDFISILDKEAEDLLNHKCKKITYDQIYRPHKDHITHILKDSDRSQKVIDNLNRIYQHGRLANTGYISILPVDQGLEHTAGYSFATNPIYFDPENIIKLGIEGGSSAVASTLGVLGLVSKKYSDKIPFILKINHNNSMIYPFKYDQIVFAQVKQAADMGAVAIGATIYFGSPESSRQIQEISKAFYQAHQLGLGTILWCYTRNNHFKTKEKDFHTSADLTGQANHLGVTIEADIIKQKLPTTNYGFKTLNYSKYSSEMYQNLTTNHPIDLVRYQVANCYMGKIPLINSGGGSGENDYQQAIKTAIINKRGGASGLIMGRKAFKKPLNEGIKILNAVQDVYLEDKITIA